MNVKCPKCRFSYEETPITGANECSCVCPRCGTPFSVKVHNEEEAHQSELPSIQNIQPATHGRSSQMTAAPRPTHEVQASPKHTSTESQYLQDKTIKKDGTTRERLREDKYFHRLLSAFILSVILVLGIALTLLSKCMGHADNLSHDATADNTFVSDTASAYTQKVEKGQQIEPPSWLYGTWQGKAKFYDITLHITPENISETEEGRTAKGTYFFDGTRLVCCFPEDSHFIYAVNTDSRTIHAGEGIILRKVVEEE